MAIFTDELLFTAKKKKSGYQNNLVVLKTIVIETT